MPMIYCRGCGAQIHDTAPMCPKCGAPQTVEAPPDGSYVGPRSFGKAITICLSKYVVWQGRAPRSEYWYWSLFMAIVYVGLAVMGAARPSSGLGVISAIVYLGLLLPSLSVQVRRLHDLGRSGWWYWICLVPIAGVILLLVWDCTRGDPGPNKYGYDPLGARAQPNVYQPATV